MQASIKELLRQYEKEVSDVSSLLEEDKISTYEDIESKIYSINEVIIKKEEAQKLQLREKLTKMVRWYIWVQLIFFNIIVLIIVLSVTFDLSYFKLIDNELATLLFEFLKYYISVTVVELLGMLGFILHYVFSKYSGIERIFKRKN